MAEADRVFLGRYRRPGPDGDGGKLRFEVLQSLKGEAGARLELARPDADDCERTFQEGELALVFVVKGHLPVCAGNVDLDAILPTLGEYLTLAGGASPAPALPAVQLALAGRIGRGRQVSVYAPSLKGRSIAVGGTKVTFVDSRGDGLLTLSGTTRGALSYLALRGPDGIATFLLVAPDRGRPAIAAQLKRDLRQR